MTHRGLRSTQRHAFSSPSSTKLDQNSEVLAPMAPLEGEDAEENRVQHFAATSAAVSYSLLKGALRVTGGLSTARSSSSCDIM